MSYSRPTMHMLKPVVDAEMLGSSVGRVVLEVSLRHQESPLTCSLDLVGRCCVVFVAAILSS